MFVGWNYTTIQIGHCSKKIAEMAYTDFKIFETVEAGILKIKELISTHERTTGARLNTRKSECLAVGLWYTSANILHIPHHQEVTILGFSFTCAVAQSGHLTWAAGKVQDLAIDTCCRDPFLEARIQYMHACLLSEIWHKPKTALTTPEQARQLLTEIYVIYGTVRFLGCFQLYNACGTRKGWCW
jgi:hypothetical protein